MLTPSNLAKKKNNDYHQSEDNTQGTFFFKLIHRLTKDGYHVSPATCLLYSQHQRDISCTIHGMNQGYAAVAEINLLRFYSQYQRDTPCTICGMASKEFTRYIQQYIHLKLANKEGENVNKDKRLTDKRAEGDEQEQKWPGLHAIVLLNDNNDNAWVQTIQLVHSAACSGTHAMLVPSWHPHSRQVRRRSLQFSNILHRSQKRVKLNFFF